MWREGVLIVAKCNVNICCKKEISRYNIVLIVAKCIVKTDYSLIF